MGMANAHRQQQFIFWRQREWDRRSFSVREIHAPQVDMQGMIQDDVNELPTIAKSKKVVRVLTPARENVSEVPSQTWKLPKDNVLQVDDSKSVRTGVTQTPTVYEPSGKKIG